MLSPANFKPLRLERDLDNKRLGERILTLPVMMAVVLSLVYRQIAGLSLRGAGAQGRRVAVGRTDAGEIAEPYRKD